MSKRPHGILNPSATSRCCCMHFSQQMPKGGDLHNHLSGAVYAESFIQ